jgi:rhodanese-related sulfurtransferase
MTSSIARIRVLLALAAVAATVTWWIHPQRPPWRAVSSSGDHRWIVDEEAARALARSGTFLYVDVRSDAAYSDGHLVDALRFAPSEWGELVFAHLDALEDHRGKPVLVYGDPPDRVSCLDVASRLRELLGMDPVYVLEGDWRVLLDSDKP